MFGNNFWTNLKLGINSNPNKVSHRAEFRSELLENNPVDTTETDGFFPKIFKKPFMPTKWKWFRTSGVPKFYRFNAPRGVITKLNFKLPKQFAPFVMDNQGNPYQDGNNFDLSLEGDTGDYFTIGGRQTVGMRDADNPLSKSVSISFPTLAFREDGIDYSLNWNRFAQFRRVAKGAYDEDWGYAREGNPTFGMASSYDRDISLTWNRSIKWWWLLIGGGLLLGLLSRRKTQE